MTKVVALFLGIAALFEPAFMHAQPVLPSSHIGRAPNEATPGLASLKAAAAVANGKIAFMSTRILSTPKIFTINADGTGVTCLMCNGATDPSGTGSTDSRTGDQPAFSPDGNTIAFVGTGGIWLMGFDGSNPRFLAPGSNPGWSPDGTKLVFTRNITGSNNDIFIMNADGTGQTNITNDPGNDVLPSWGAVLPNHPQGRIVFRSSRSGNSELYVIAPTSLAETFQTSPQINITTNPKFDSAAKWSPDGQMLVFVSNRDSLNNEIYTFDLNTFVVTRLTNDAFVDDTPVWSPDGTKIAYTSFRAGSNEIIVIDSSTGAAVTPPAAGNITNNAATDASPSWQSTVPLFTVTYDGKLRDKVSGSDSGTAADGNLDATFTVQFQPGNGTRFITGLDLTDANGNEWDTVAGNAKWVLGATYSIDGTLLNQASGTINSQLGTQGHLRLFASDTSPTAFGSGKIFTLVISFSDGTSSSQRFTIPPTPALTLVFDGKLRDKVGQRETVTVNPDPDGNPDGTFTVLLPIGGQRITKLDICQKSVACVPTDTGINRWDTVPSNGKWVVGFADTLDSGLLNAADGSIPSGLQFGTSFKIFFSDIFPNPSVFVEGSPFTLTVTFADNTTASATTTVEVTPGVNLAPAVSGPSTAAARQSIQYTLNVTNQGSNGATGVKLVSDAFPANVNFISSSGPHGCTFGSDRRVTCTIGGLPAGGAAGADTITVAPQTPGSSFTLNVVASANESSVPNHASQTTTIGVTSANLQIDATNPASSVLVGDFIDYTIQVSNLGPSSATGVVLTVTFPAGTTFTSITGTSCSAPTTTVSCTIGSLPVAVIGAPAQLTQIRAVPGSVGQFNVTASVKGDDTDPIDVRNSVPFSSIVKPKLDLIGLEVTQAVQDLANSVPLIQGKATYVRAHIKASNAKSEGTKITGGLTATSLTTGKSLGRMVNSNNPRMSIDTRQNPDRGLLDHSLYFQIPDIWTVGNMQFTVDVDQAPLTCSEPDGTPDCKAVVLFQPRKSFDIKFLLGKWQDAALNPHVSTDADVARTTLELKTILPISSVTSRTAGFNTTTNPCDATFLSTGIGSLREFTETSRVNECKSNSACSKFYEMLLADQNACAITVVGKSQYPINGVAWGIPSNSAIAFTNANKNPSLSDFNSRVHELSHSLGNYHTDSGQGEGGPNTSYSPTGGAISPNTVPYAADTAYGFDTNNISGTRIYPPSTEDFMTYARPRWVSVYNYKRLFGLVQSALAADAPNSLTAQGLKSEQVVSASSVALVRGSIDGGSATIAPLYVSAATAPVVLPSPGTYAIRLVDAQGAEIASYPFQASKGSEGTALGFSLLLPWDANARRIELLQGGQVIASRQASAAAPAVQVTSPNGGESLTGSSASFSWTGSDTDGDLPVYLVEYSPDNGATWNTLAIDWKASPLPVDLTKLMGSSQALIRVTASDGFNSAQDQSDALFSVARHAPTAFVVGAQDNRLYSADQMVILNGLGFDIEDGSIAAGNLVWSSNLDGQLVIGEQLAVPASSLKEGTHTMTVTARDSDGQTGSASVAIIVARATPVLPAMLSSNALEVGFTVAKGSAASAAQTITILNVGDGTLVWSASADQPWIQLGASGGTAPSPLTVSVDPTGLSPGPHSGNITVSASGVTGSPLQISVRIFVTDSVVRIDIDGNGTYDARTDGLLMIRYLFGLTGPSLTAGAVGSGPTRSSPADIQQFLDGIKLQVDIDGNGQSDALTDGLMFIRYLFGLRGQALITGAIGSGATRTTAEQIEQYIQSLLP